MTDRIKEDLALRADTKRQATDSLRGYLYQIWHSIHAWLDLSDEEALFLEAAEDFDIVDSEKGTAVQVKDTAANVTLRSQAVIDAIAHFWHLRNAHPGRVIRFKLLTRSAIGIEKGQPFGSGIAGLKLWQLSLRELQAVEKLRTFLLEDDRLPSDLKNFLSTSNSETILKQLIFPITWETSSKDASYVEEAIERKLIYHGDKHGIPPSKSVSVINRLLKEALTRASQKSQRFVDRATFLRIFEEETTIRVPAHQLQTLTAASLEQDPLISSLFQNDSYTSLQLAPVIHRGIPSFRGIMSHRETLTNDLLSCLSETGLLIVTGSVGMGKTVLAKLAAIRNGSEWLWLNVSNRDPKQILGILRQLAIFIERERNPINIVLDDLYLSPAYTRLYEDYLGGLLYTLFDRGGRIVITSQKSPPRRLSHLLGVNPRSLQKAPSFTEEEITDFALRLGCKGDKLARSWAKVVLLHTKGHPQLVHARLLNLSDNGWPSLTANHLLKTPSDILHERSMARDLLINQLSKADRELIYRLSIILGPFRRDQAIALADNDPSIERPGDAFDHLIGPWIEPLYGEYYRVSPLLENAAFQVWSSEKVKSLHGNIVRAIITCGKLTTLEASTILIHAWIGRDGRTLAYAIHCLLISPKEVWKSMVHEVSWVIYISLDPTEAPFPENAFINFAFRMLQFRIATQVDRKVAVTIAEAWDKETTFEGPQELHISKRLLLISQVLIYYQIDISPSKLVSLLAEMANLLEKPGQATTSLRDFRPPRGDPFYEAKFDLISYLFCFLIPRCSGISFLSELLEALETTSGELRKRMLNAFNIFELQATLLIDGVWLKVAESEDKNWESCIEVFEKTIKLALQWEVPPLARAAARGLAIVYEEYLNDPPQAFAALDKVRTLLGSSSVILDDEQATVFFHLDKYEKALEIWEKILSGWFSQDPSDLTPIFACRKAAICAAHIGDWKKAYNFFKEGFKRSRGARKPAFRIGFLADAAFALWKTGEYEKLLKTFVKVLKGIGELPDPEKDLTSFTLKKMVGHILLWIENNLEGRSSVQLTEPIPGMCTNPEYTEKIREFPDSPIDFSWLKVSQIEYHLNLGSSIFNAVYRRFINSPFPTIRWFLAILDIRHSFRLLRFESLPVQVNTLDVAYQASTEHYAEGKKVFEEAPREINGKYLARFKMSETELFFAASVSLAGAERMKAPVFEIWRKKAKGIPRNSNLIRWINLGEKMLTKETREAFNIMANKAEDRDIRLLAALKVGNSGDASPNEMFYAHTLLAADLLQGLWAKDVAEYLASLISRQWLKMTELHAILIAPRFTVPEIKAACKSEVNGIHKSARILISASNAVSIRLPKETLLQLREFAKEKG